MADLHKKYPKWSHRKKHSEAAKRRQRARRIAVRISRAHKRKRKKVSTPDVTQLLLLQLLQQIQGNTVIRTPSMKHGSNGLTGYGGAVRPGRLAPIASRDERARILGQRGGGAGVGVGAAAHAGHNPRGAPGRELVV